MKKTSTPWPFVISLALLALAAAALILLLPQLFQGGSSPQPWLYGVLGGLAVAGAFGTRQFKPEHPNRT